MSAKKITSARPVKVIKIETDRPPTEGSGETITDIQNYLQTFNKEIEGGDGQSASAAAVKFERANSTEVQAETTVENGEDGGTYFVDQSGQYYYQTRTEDGQSVMAVVQDMENATGINNQFVSIGDAQTEENDPIVNDEVQVVNEHGQMVLGGADSFQTVTIVPSETGQGEVSYVLIVQQPEEKSKDEDQDLTVYDFDDQEEPGAISGAESIDDEDKSKVVKIVPKKSQTVTQPHMCNYCNYTSPKRYLLSRHMKSHSEERPHKCSVCERGFKTLASLQNHVNTHTGTKPHRCKYCTSAFTTSGELVRHVRYKHTHEKPHKCTICEYASVELSKMRNHMRSHTGERPYQCPHCTYASPDTFKLKRHLRIHTGEKPYECHICHARFTQSNSLKAHKLIHSEGLKPVYHCELCPTTCGRKTDLRIHVQKLHTSDKPLKCKRCGKHFPDRYTYKVHNKSHEGEKCWKCNFCPYASASERHLDSHMLIHTDQKPFQCEQCDQSFRQRQLLRRHQNLYHNPNYVPPVPKEKTHECPECQKAFRHKGNLIRHMSTHDPESSVHEKALALKLGRQKKIQIINGQQVEVILGEGDECEDMDENTESSVVAVEGSDGRQYVVLEVIHLQDGDGQEQQVAVMAGDHTIEQAVAALNTGQSDGSEAILPHSIKDIDMSQEDPLGGIVLKTEVKRRNSVQHDMDNCFGFDEDDDDDDNEDSKTTSIDILPSAL